MTRVHFRAGVYALVPALAVAVPVASTNTLAAQDTCSCDTGEFPLITSNEGAPFAFWMGSRARIGVGFSADGQDGSMDVGAVISEVGDGSPAEEAGIEVGDIVISVDGHNLMEPLESRLESRVAENGSAPVQRLMALARTWEADEPIELELLRDGNRTTVTVVPTAREMDFGPLQLRMGKLGESLEQMAPRIERQMRGLEGAPRIRTWAGDNDGFEFRFGPGAINELELTEVNPRLGSYFGVDAGVLVIEVGEESGLGLEPGDVILKVGGRDVAQPRDVRRILTSYDDDETVSFEVRRDGSTRTVAGTVG